MLEPGSQRLLVDAVRPPSGYKLDHALITTYSLNLTAMLSVPLALTFSDWQDEAGRPSVDPVALLEALQRTSDRLTIACQAGEIAVPASQQNLFAFFEPAIRPVLAPQGGVFHPKVWIMRFAPGDASDGPILYRMLCSSRNLTFDRSWDLMLVLEGELRSTRRRVRMNGPLEAFVYGVADLAMESLGADDPDRRDALALLTDEVGRVEFESPSGLDLIAFHPLGLARASSDPFAERRRDRNLIVSPFIAEGRLERMAGEKDWLVSSQAELDSLPAEALEHFAQDRVFVLDQLALSEETPVEAERDQAGGTESERLADSADGGLQGLHAKLFVSDAGHRCSIWMGSANATNAAFSRNVEFLVELDGSKYKQGVGPLIEEPDAVLRPLLAPYRRNEDGGIDPDQRKAESVADDIAHSLGGAPLRLLVEPLGDGRHRMAVSIEGPLDLTPADEVTCWPITLKRDRASRIHPSGELPTWEPLSTAQLTGFAAFRIRVTVGPRHVEREIVVKGELVGAPEDRDGAVMRSILESAEQLMRYLAFLLADPDSDNEIAPGDLTGDVSPGSQPGDHQIELPLLEGLVRALERDPARLDRIEALVTRLSATKGGREIIPAEFLEVWEPIREARKALVR